MDEEIESDPFDKRSQSEEYRFYFSIAACLHQQKAYQEAMKDTDADQ